MVKMPTGWQAGHFKEILVSKRGCYGTVVQRAPGAKLVALLCCIPSGVLSLGETVGKAVGGDASCLFLSTLKH